MVPYAGCQTMKPSTIAWAMFLSLAPISELRGAIPFSLANGMPVAAAFALCVGVNMLVGPIAWLFLSTLHRLLSRWRPYASAFDRIVERARRKVHAAVERWGYWGLAVFVAIPLPFTGAWTGALGAWVLGMEVRKSLAAVAAGVLVAGVVVTLVAFFGIKAFSIFLKT
jgi:uncharacterized membrane protein